MDKRYVCDMDKRYICILVGFDGKLVKAEDHELEVDNIEMFQPEHRKFATTTIRPVITTNDGKTEVKILDEVPVEPME